MIKLLLIDGDGLVYHSSKDTFQLSIDTLEEKLENMFEKTEATHFIIFMSNTPYFRHEIDPNYKAARGKYITTLKWIKTLKNYLVEAWGATSMYKVESDDLVAFWYKTPIYAAKIIEDATIKFSNIPFEQTLFDSSPLEITKIICSPDKDLLQSIEGKHFNYTYKLKKESESKDKMLLTDADFDKGWWVETTSNYAEFFKWKQLLMGDASDSVIGIPKWGEKTAEKYLNSITNVNSDTVTYANWCFDAYLAKYGTYQGVFEYQKNMRLLHLLNTPEDFLREVKTTPLFPYVRTVKCIKQEENF